MSHDELDEQLLDIADRLYLTLVHLLRRVRRADETLDLSASQMSALTRLVQNGPMLLGELAAAEGVQPPSMTRLVQKLEEGGYVIRRPDPDDGRAVRLAHTSAGMMQLEAGRVARVATFGAQLAALSKDELDKLTAALGLLEALSREPENE